MLRKIGLLIAGLLVLVVLAAGGFRVAAMWRESQTQQQAAGKDANFVYADGIHMHYRQWGPAGGKPLLLVPGTMAWSETFRDIAKPLGQQGNRVIAIDMPPFGYSERPAGHDYSRAAQAKRILGFADALGLATFRLGVHSYGGGAALEAAFLAPDRVEAVVLLDVALGLGKEASDGPPLASLLSVGLVRNTAMALTFTNPMMIGKGLRDFIFDDSIVTDERIALYQRPMDVSGTTDAIGHWLFTGLFNDESRSLAADRARYRAFDKPVLVIWGKQDTVTPLAQGEEIASLLPRATLHVLDGVNHIPHVEKPDQVTGLMGDFLGGLERQKKPLKLDGDLRGPIAWNDL